MRFDKVNIEIGDLIRKRRTELGLSQQDFAERVGISRASVANIERGKQSVSVQQLFEFSNGLNATPTDILPNYQRNDLNEHTEQTRSWILSVIKEAQNA